MFFLASFAFAACLPLAAVAAKRIVCGTAKSLKNEARARQTFATIHQAEADALRKFL